MLRPNPGRCPPEAEGKRVRVILRNGFDTAKPEPGGWAADGKNGCRWTKNVDQFDIAKWELIK